METGFMASAKGKTGSVYPSHSDAAAAMAATLRSGTKFKTVPVRVIANDLVVTEYKREPSKEWRVSHGTAVMVATR